jgi:hypothetical protein
MHTQPAPYERNIMLGIALTMAAPLFLVIGLLILYVRKLRQNRSRYRHV